MIVANNTDEINDSWPMTILFQELEHNTQRNAIRSWDHNRLLHDHPIVNFNNTFTDITVVPQLVYILMILPEGGEANRYFGTMVELGHFALHIWMIRSHFFFVLCCICINSHCAKKPVTTMLTYPWKCTVLHCNHLGNTWKPLVLMTRHFDYCPSASEGDNQSVRSSAPVVSRCFPGGYNVKLYISRGRLAWWLLAYLCCERNYLHIYEHGMLYGSWLLLYCFNLEIAF